MILAKALFPSQDICIENEMYFKGSKFKILENNIIEIDRGGLLSSSTYFNSFSIAKWTKYTVIKNLNLKLTLKGSFEVCLYSMDANDGVVSKKLLSKTEFQSKKQSDLIIACDLQAKSIIYFDILSKDDDSCFYGFEYSTEVDELLINKVNLAIGICTFRREQFVIKNLKRLTEVISDPDSPLYHKAKVFVSDNGQTLSIDELSNEVVKVVYNKNYGGAGGFTRTLLEAMREQNDNNFTNFIFMDDDIVLDVAAVEKTYRFLSLLKPEYKKSVIGGAMFSTDKTYLQFENGAKWTDNGFKFHLRDIDLRTNLNIVLNEKDKDVNYNAWCYCCIPFEVVKTNNLPLPIFFHMDDVEYGLRNKLPIISLNGINVWHLYKKGLVNAKNDYYDIRNRLIMLSEIAPHLVYKFAYMYFGSFTSEIFKYHYARAINAFDGILDFCKGFDYFKKLDTLKKHSQLFNNVKWVDATNTIKKKAVLSEKDFLGKKFKLKSLFKFLFKLKKKEIVIFNENTITDACKSRKVCVYEAQENKCITYKKNIFLFAKCALRYLKVRWVLKHKLGKAIEDYRNNINSVQDIDFWNKYLNLPQNKYNKKVLFVASDNDKTSGAFRSMVALNVLLNQKYNVKTTVLLPKMGDGEILLKENNLSHVTINSEDWIVKLEDDKKVVRNKKKLIKKNKVAYKKYLKFLKQNKFDIVHINTSYHYAIVKAAKKLNIPVVWHIREFLEEDQKRRFINKDFAHKTINSSTKIVAISKSIEDKYKPYFGGKIIKIYNGIDLETYLNESKTIFNLQKVKFICTGAIVEYKGQHLLLEALGKLKNQGLDDFEVLLIGNNVGPYMTRINSLIQEYSLQSNVKILGRQNNVERFYKDADIMFVGSRSEAFGRITVEAMLGGCLVIGSNSAGTKEIIEHEKTGLLFDHENIDDLCEKISFALSHKEEMKKIADAGRTHAKENYSAEQNADEIYKLYDEILKERN